MELIVEKELIIEKELADQLEIACFNGISDCGRSEVIFDEEVTFPDGNIVAIQVIAPEELGETAWSQGVLFDSFGNEIGVTEVSDFFLGEYQIDNYLVNVRKGEKGQQGKN